MLEFRKYPGSQTSNSVSFIENEDKSCPNSGEDKQTETGENAYELASTRTEVNRKNTQNVSKVAMQNVER